MTRRTVSSRKIERACHEDLAFRVLTGNQQPDHSRISNFRRRNLEALKGLFVQILRLCQKAGMVSLGHVALDGTKVKANASKHKAMSHERMLRAEKQLAQEINALMRKAEILDAQEDRCYGKTNRGSDLPDELRRRQDRLERIRQARKEIEAETAAAAARQRQEEANEARAEADAAMEADAPAAEQAELNQRAEAAAAKAIAAREKAIEAAQEAGLEPPDLEPLAAEAMPRRGLARKANGAPTQKTRRNFTDADSHLMKSDGHYIQGYNGQLAVDSDHQVIVALGVSNQAPDVEHLGPMLQRIAATAGARTDAGERGCESTDGPQAEKQDRISDLRQAQGDRGAGERPDQGSQGSATLLAAGPGEGGCGMAPDCRDAQPAQAVQIQAMPAAGACIGKWMKGLMAAIRAESPTGTH
jgi:hypothetical protein